MHHPSLVSKQTGVEDRACEEGRCPDEEGKPHCKFENGPYADRDDEDENVDTLNQMVTETGV